MNPNSRYSIKRQTDLQILSEWIDERSNVLDLGCGRGVFLEHLQQARHAYCMGIDTSAEKIRDCVKRGVNAYQGDILEVLPQYQDNFFDWVICSRTLQELSNPQDVIHEALRVGRNLAVGFVNYGYWRNRLHMLRHGSRIRNEAFPENWWESRAQNPVSIGTFEEFCKQERLTINRRVFLASDWRSECAFLPSWRCGYAIYAISREQGAEAGSATPATFAATNTGKNTGNSHAKAATNRAAANT